MYCPYSRIRLDSSALTPPQPPLQEHGLTPTCLRCPLPLLCTPRYIVAANMYLYFLLSVSGIRPTVEYVVPGGDVANVHALTLFCGVLMCFYEGMLLKAKLFSPASSKVYVATVTVKINSTQKNLPLGVAFCRGCVVSCHFRHPTIKCVLMCGAVLRCAVRLDRTWRGCCRIV